MDKLLVGKSVADKLRTTEASIDQALADAAKLLEVMIASRGELKLAAEAGDGAVIKLTGALTALSQARTAVVDTHCELSMIARRLGIKTAFLGEAEGLKNASFDNSTVSSVDRRLQAG